MSRVRMKALALIAVASGLLVFEAIVLVGVAVAMGGVCQRNTSRRLHVIRTTQVGSTRVLTVSTVRDRQVREAVEAAVRKAAL